MPEEKMVDYKTMYEQLKEKYDKLLEENKNLEKDNLVLQYEKSKALEELNRIQKQLVAIEIKNKFPELIKDNKA